MKVRATVLFFLALSTWSVPAALGATENSGPAWQLSLIPLPTNLSQGSSGTANVAPVYSLTATNIGGEASGGPVSFSAVLPSGIKPLGAFGDDGGAPVPDPSCKKTSQQTISCATEGPIYPGRWLGARIPVEVTANIGEVLTASASIGGGGAATATASYTTTISPEQPPFGFLSNGADPSAVFTRSARSIPGQAGSHPGQLTVSLALPTEQPAEGFPTTGAGHLRDLITDLPQGLVANPTATSVRCTEAELLSGSGTEPGCPDASQVGVISSVTEITGPQLTQSALYNMVPVTGVPATLAFNAVNSGIFIHIQGGLRSDGNYGIKATTADIPALTVHPIESVQAQLWGDPSSESYDQIRGGCRARLSLSFCPVPVSLRTGKPFLTMPSACSNSMNVALHADSWEQPGVFREAEAPGLDTAGAPIGVSGCSALDFRPKLTLRPNTGTAETPTALHVDLEVPQNEKKEETATSNLKDTMVTFPEGLALNPAAATGLKACAPDQIGLRTATGATPIHFSQERPRCPRDSKIGSVEVSTPLLDHPVSGAVYVAQPYQNPFGTLLGIYVVIDDPADGIVAKLAGKTEIINQETGQLQTTFSENPELPFEHFKVDLFGGPRAALRTPATCGTFTTTSLETPWSGSAPVSTADSFVINQGANGRPCVTSEAQLPNSPSFEAGTATPLAGSFSPFLGRLQRADGTQQLKGLNLTLAPGISGKLAGIPSCPAAAIDAAAAKSGAQEQQSPSCPAASQVGEVLVGAGVGPQPYYTNAKVYLAGPYKGGPVSAVIITPAVAGPFDLGTVVTRAALYVNPLTAQITVKSDPIPRQLQGIQLQVRDVRVNMSRPSFTLNPTNCDPMAITGEAISVFNQVAPLSNRFQVGGCKGLDYEPKLALRLHGGTKRGAHPKLRAVLTAKFGEANTARASVALPKSEFLENAHIQTVCTRVQFAAENCPAKSIYGHATAITPLLDEPLEGPVYLRSSSHKLPDMVAALKGPPSRPIKVELDGRIDAVNGGIRSSFDLVPDQPVTKFILSMQGGKKGLLVNSRNLCAGVNRAAAKFKGQNGKVHDFNPVLANDCKGKAKKNGSRSAQR